MSGFRIVSEASGGAPASAPASAPLRIVPGPAFPVPSAGPAERTSAPLPPGMSTRTLAVLREVGLLGPAPFAMLERLAPFLVPGLAGRRSLRRLLYRELERLEAARLVVSRRLPLAAAGVYAVTAAGADLLRAHDLADVPPDALERFLAFPDHEAGLRRFRAELLRARFADAGGGRPGLATLALDDRARFDLDAGRAYEPDGHYVLGLPDGQERVLLVELDRTTKPLAAWRDKTTKAAAVMATLDTRARLLVLALAPRRLATLLDVAAEVLGPRRDSLRGAVLEHVTSSSLWLPVFGGAGRQTGLHLL